MLLKLRSLDAEATALQYIDILSCIGEMKMIKFNFENKTQYLQNLFNFVKIIFKFITHFIVCNKE